MLSGLSDQEVVQQAFGAGANDYLVKPIDDRKLIRAIEQQLAKLDENRTD
jgi:YesN/AraC family two-component response regulator